MKQVFEDYAGVILYGLLSFVLIHTSISVFDMHQELFKFETSEFKAERMFDKTDIPEIYASHRYLLLNENFDPLEGVYALDKKDGRINEVMVSGSIDTSKSGMYTLNYFVVNSLGLHNNKEIFVWVENYENDD